MGAGSVSAAADPDPLEVNCDHGETIGAVISQLKSGDTLTVSGTCRESVLIPRQLTKVTLDGQGSATIQGPAADIVPTSPAAFAVFVEGTDVTIKGFTIVGGSHGIHLSGPATAVVNNNVIRESGGAIHLDKGSIGQIVNNTLEDNSGFGINIQENSYARIGFTIPTQKQMTPNTIRNNTGAGIVVSRWSSAWIVGNKIAGNGSHGIMVDRASQADVVGNTIDRNHGDAIRATHNSGVNLESEGKESVQVGTNGTAATSPNTGVGISCSIGGYVAGPRGTLSGTQGTKTIDTSCVDRTTPKGKR
jgi:nitrous oxidase accessory protein NosD